MENYPSTNDDNIEYTETEESDEDENRGDGRRVQSQVNATNNKRPITELRQANKSIITESVEQQKRRDVVLAAQIAQAQVEKERRRQHDERSNQKMTNIQSMHAQDKSKSTSGRRAEKSEDAKKFNKEAVHNKQQRNMANTNSSFLPNITADRSVYDSVDKEKNL